VVAGEGPALPALRAQAARLGLGDSVRFTGYLDRHRDCLPDCYAAADVFVFASRTETQGLVLLEADGETLGNFLNQPSAWHKGR
jgi:1,2-diacylglycerol 3-alpha-glucosyltransferase